MPTSSGDKRRRSRRASASPPLTRLRRAPCARRSIAGVDAKVPTRYRAVPNGAHACGRIGKSNLIPAQAFPLRIGADVSSGTAMVRKGRRFESDRGLLRSALLVRGIADLPDAADAARVFVKYRAGRHGSRASRITSIAGHRALELLEDARVVPQARRRRVP